MTSRVSVMDRLLGWDLAYSTSFAALNRAISEGGATPSDMTFDGSSMGLGKLSGTFGTWQLVADDNAAGKTVVLDIPFHVTSFEINGRSFADKQYTYRANVVLEFSLHKTLPNGAEVKHLKTQGPDPETLVNESVVIQASSSDVLEMAIGNALEAWLKQNIQTFTHVFSETLTMLEDANPVFSKLMPKALSYAVKCPEAVAPQGDPSAPATRDLDRCVFSVLCLLDDVATAGLVAQTDLSLLPEDCDGGIAISSGVLLNKMLAPAFVAALNPQSPLTLEMSGGLHPLLTNTTDAVLPDFDLSEIDGFDPGVKGLRPTLERGDLQFSLDGPELRVDFVNLSFESSDRLTSFTINYTGRFTAALTPEGHLTLSDTAKSEAQVSVHVTEYGQDYQIWSNLAVQVVLSLLCLIPGGEAAEGVDAGAEAGAEGLVATTGKVTVDVADISAKDAALADAEATESLLAKVGTKALNSLKRFGPRFGKALAKGLGVVLAVITVTEFPTLLSFLRQKTANPTPTMHDLAERVMSANLWNGAGAGKVTCVSAEFDDGITLGLKFSAHEGSQA